MLDLLQDIVGYSGLKTKVLNPRTLGSAAPLTFDCYRSLGFHFVVEGRATVTAIPAGPTYDLGPGELLLMARGASHRLEVSSDPEAPGPAAESRVLSGLLEFWNAPIHPFFRELPEWTRLQVANQEAQHLQRVAEIASWEIRRDEVSDRVLGLLVELFLINVFRLVLDQHRDLVGSWSRAVSDPVLARALEHLHRHWRRNWSLESLAKESGTSRARLSHRFRVLLGESPAHYLAKIRMQRAMELLTETDDTLEGIAHAVGYGDGFGFSRAFKRIVGSSPNDYRREHGRRP